MDNQHWIGYVNEDCTPFEFGATSVVIPAGVMSMFGGFFAFVRKGPNVTAIGPFEDSDLAEEFFAGGEGVVTTYGDLGPRIVPFGFKRGWRYETPSLPGRVGEDSVVEIGRLRLGGAEEPAENSSPEAYRLAYARGVYLSIWTLAERFNEGVVIIMKDGQIEARHAMVGGFTLTLTIPEDFLDNMESELKHGR